MNAWWEERDNASAEAPRIEHAKPISRPVDDFSKLDDEFPKLVDSIA